MAYIAFCHRLPRIIILATHQTGFCSCKLKLDAKAMKGLYGVLNQNQLALDLEMHADLKEPHTTSKDDIHNASEN